MFHSNLSNCQNPFAEGCTATSLSGLTFSGSLPISTVPHKFDGGLPVSENIAGGPAQNQSPQYSRAVVNVDHEGNMDDGFSSAADSRPRSGRFIRAQFSWRRPLSPAGTTGTVPGDSISKSSTIFGDFKSDTSVFGARKASADETNPKHAVSTLFCCSAPSSSDDVVPLFSTAGPVQSPVRMRKLSEGQKSIATSTTSTTTLAQWPLFLSAQNQETGQTSLGGNAFSRTSAVGSGDGPQSLFSRPKPTNTVSEATKEPILGLRGQLPYRFSPTSSYGTSRRIIPGLFGQRPPKTRLSEELGSRLKSNKVIPEPVVLTSTSVRPLANSASASTRKRKALSPEILTQIRLLKLYGVPKESNNQQFLKQHFKIFGRVDRVECRRTENVAYVWFADHEGARNAKLKGDILRPGTKPVKIEWELLPNIRTLIVQWRNKLGSSSSDKGIRVSVDEECVDDSVFGSSILQDNSDRSDEPGSIPTTVETSSTTTFEAHVENVPEQNLDKESNYENTVEEEDVEREESESAATQPLADETVQRRPLFSVVSKPSALTSGHFATPNGKATPLGSSGKKTQPNSTVLKVEKPALLLPAAIAQELKTLVGRRAVTVLDKYECLEERDKIIRKARTKKASVGVGTCKDMCPEKERYQRESRQQVSSFEGRGGVMDPYRAVKNYTRSAADQEEPLPHELRPSSTLYMTMVYLLKNVIGSAPPADSDLVHWFDFLWKRTRAIRKELTQQKLCDPLAVELFEQIARFHIYAAHWLSFLESCEFDQRINTENLLKCLQSLHQQYEDLSKREIHCENEPEFRSYQIILNMNNTNVLRQVLSWDNWVRESPLVHNALRLCSAVQSNSYVLFFRIIADNRTSYLQACAAHRYFNQMRKQALLTMVRAYGMNQQFPISELTQWLGFEKQQDCMEFVSQFGLITGVEECPFVMLNRTSYVEPESNLAEHRSFNLIESKRRIISPYDNRLLPLCILLYGKDELPTIDNYQPTNSFDESGRYVNDPVVQQLWDEHLQHAGVSTSEQNLAATDTWTKRLQELNEKRLQENAVKQIGNAIETEVLVEEVKPVVVEQLALAFSDTLLNATVAEICRALASECHSQKVLHQNQTEELVLKTYLQLVSIVANDFVKTIAETEHRHSLQRYVDANAQHMLDTLLYTAVESLTKDICSRVFQLDVVDRLTKLKSISEHLSQFRLRRYFLHWQDASRRASAKKRTLSLLPPTCLNRSAMQCVRNLGVKRRRVLAPDFAREKLQNLISLGTKMDAENTQLCEPIEFVRQFESELRTYAKRLTVSGRIPVISFRVVVVLAVNEKNYAEHCKMSTLLLKAKLGIEKDNSERFIYTRLDHETSVCFEVQLLETHAIGNPSDITKNLANADACILFCDTSFPSTPVADVLEQGFLHCGHKIPVCVLCCVDLPRPATVPFNVSSRLRELNCANIIHHVHTVSLVPDWFSKDNNDKLQMAFSAVIQRQPKDEFMSISLECLMSESLLNWIFIPLGIQCGAVQRKFSIAAASELTNKALLILKRLRVFLDRNSKRLSDVLSPRASEGLALTGIDRLNLILEKMEFINCAELIELILSSCSILNCHQQQLEKLVIFSCGDIENLMSTLNDEVVLTELWTEEHDTKSPAQSSVHNSFHIIHNESTPKLPEAEKLQRRSGGVMKRNGYFDDFNLLSPAYESPPSKMTSPFGADDTVILPKTEPGFDSSCSAHGEFQELSSRLERLRAEIQREKGNVLIDGDES